MKQIKDWINPTIKQIRQWGVLKQSKPGYAKPVKSALHCPAFHQQLPYRLYCDGERTCFIQENSIGVGWILSPFSGLDEAMVENLHHLVTHTCEPTDILECYLLANNQVADLLDQGIPDQGIRAWAKEAAQFNFKHSGNLKASLRDMQLFCFLTRGSKGKASEIDALLKVREALASQLRAMNWPHARVNIDGFLRLMGTLFSSSPHQVIPQSRSFQKHRLLHEQLLPMDFELTQSKESFQIHQSVQGKPQTTTVQVLGVDQWPSELTIWAMPDAYAPLKRAGVGIPCPFLIVFQLKGLKADVAQSQIQKNFKQSRQKAASGEQEKVAGLNQRAAEWHEVREGYHAGDYTLVKMHYQVILFSDPKKAQDDLTGTQSSYRAQGIELQPLSYLQVPGFLMSLPMASSGGLWQDFDRAGRLKLLPSWQAIQFMPVISDPKLGRRGLLLPSFRHQLCFFDPFDEQLPNTNFNIAVAGTTGSGKSFLIQSMLKQVLDQGGLCFVVDVGESYRKLCEHLGAVYLSASDLRLNPFTGLTTLKNSAELIRDLFAVMASPHQSLEGLSQQYLLDAIQIAFDQTGDQTNVDDVVRALTHVRELKNDPKCDELATLLTNYTTTGTHGKIFNTASHLVQDKRLVVLELGELDNSPKLLKAVLLALMITIENVVYQSDRSVKKLVIFDEAWRLFSGDNAMFARAIEKGYRTARKFGTSFVTITQGLEDYLKGSEAQACFNNSSMKLILKQDAKGFEIFRQKHKHFFTDYVAEIIQQFVAAKQQGFSECLLQCGASQSFHRLFVDPFSKVLFSSHHREFEAVKRLQQAGLSLRDAIEQVARHYYGDEFDLGENA